MELMVACQGIDMRGNKGLGKGTQAFLDQTSVRSVLSFLVIGDLAFFYDMNSIRI